jgi:hypothetical protein
LVTTFCEVLSTIFVDVKERKEDRKEGKEGWKEQKKRKGVEGTVFSFSVSTSVSATNVEAGKGTGEII